MAEGLEAGGSYHRKQVMQLVSKMRFLAAQIDALLEDDRWLVGGRHANAMASQLATALATAPGVRIAYPVESNGVFTELSRKLADRLLQDWSVQVWSEASDGSAVLRWMTAFDTAEDDVTELASAIMSAALEVHAQGSAGLAG
jgi:threonine aldolase